MPPGDAAVGAPSPASASPASGPAVPAASALPSLAGSPSAALRRRGPRRDRQAVFEFHDDDDVSDALEDDEDDDDDDDNDDDNDSLASDAALAPQDFYAALDATLAARAFRGAVLRTHPLAAASAHARPMTPMAPTASPAATAFAASAASNAATSLPLDVPRPPSARDFPAPFTASASFSSRAASLSSASSSSSTTSVATASTEHENDSASGSDADRTGRAAAAAARRRRRPQAYPAARQPPQGLHGLQAVHAAPYGGKPAAYAAAWPADPRSPAITAFLPRRARSASVPWHAAAAAPP
ncbi:hypothetical protein CAUPRSCDRAFT_10742 [Caulochytrium protostelioides]|uniref:Uncharacterized protein n=1 Tax=Caulochytrium protostelioides TaxID=1555241 RepID=A0A4P9WW08_9FUNG|nr:hypothetical protein CAUPRSCDRAFT_10742 [Caulochytrium protostelioides]